MRFFFSCPFPPGPPAHPRCTLQPGASSPGMDSGRLGRTGLRWLSTARGAQALGAPKSQTGQALRCRSGRAFRSSQRAGPRVAPGRRSGLRLASCGGAGAARCRAPPRRTVTADAARGPELPGGARGGLDEAELRPPGLRRLQEWTPRCRCRGGARWAGVGPRGTRPGTLQAPGGLQPLSWGLGGPERASGEPPPAGCGRPAFPATGSLQLSGLLAPRSPQGSPRLPSSQFTLVSSSLLTLPPSYLVRLCQFYVLWHLIWETQDND